MDAEASQDTEIASHLEEKGDSKGDLYAGSNSLQDHSRAVRLRGAVRMGGGRKAVAARANIHPQSLTRYLAGRDPQSATMAALADATGVSLEWLATGRGAMAAEPVEYVSMHAQGEHDRPVTAAEFPPGYAPIARFDVAASAGAGSLVEHPQVVEYMAYSQEYLRLVLHRRPEDLGLILARGDSMEPTIRDGDVLTVDIRPGQALQNGRLYVLQVGETLLVKRVEMRLNSVVLHSDNSRYTPETLDRSAVEQLHVIGQVILVSTPPR